MKYCNDGSIDVEVKFGGLIGGANSSERKYNVCISVSMNKNSKFSDEDIKLLIGSSNNQAKNLACTYEE